MKQKIFQSLPETLLYTLLLIALSFNIINARINSDNAQKAKEVAAQVAKAQAEYQEQTVAARKANIERQADMIDHFDCVVLLSKKYPDVNFQALSYDEAKTYLNKCATTE